MLVLVLPTESRNSLADDVIYTCVVHYRVHDVTDADCQSQTSSALGGVFGAFSRQLLTN